MTYTVAARCPETGQFGLAVATYSIVVGQLCDGVLANVGAVITQAFPRQSNHAAALRMLDAGLSPAHVLQLLQADDPHGDYRQTCIIGRSGTAVVHTGSQARGWAGHSVGEHFAVFGNVLAGERVVSAMHERYARQVDETFENRLLATLEAARDAGGQAGKAGPLAERSAAIVVVDREHYAELDLRVDLNDSAVHELRRLFEIYKPYHAYYRLRATAPGTGIPQEEFQASLDRQARSPSVTP